MITLIGFYVQDVRNILSTIIFWKKIALMPLIMYLKSLQTFFFFLLGLSLNLSLFLLPQMAYMLEKLDINSISLKLMSFGAFIVSNLSLGEREFNITISY